MDSLAHDTLSLGRPHFGQAYSASAFSFAVISRIGFGPKNVICLDNVRRTGPRETAARYHVKMRDSFVKLPSNFGGVFERLSFSSRY